MRKKSTIFERSKTTEDTLVLLQKEEGTSLTKVEDKGKFGITWIQQPKRKLKLDMSNHCLEYSKEEEKGGQPKQLSLRDIKDVLSGYKTNTFLNPKFHPKSKHADPKKLAFSIIFIKGYKDNELNLLAADEETRDAWVKAIDHLLKKRHNSKEDQDYFLREKFQKADANNSKKLNFEEMVQLCNMLNINISKEDLQQVFDESNTEKNGPKYKGKEGLDENEFVTAYKKISHKFMIHQEIEKIFQKYSTKDGNTNSARMIPADFIKFTKIEQKEDLTLETCVEIIKTFEFSEDKESFSSEGFARFIMCHDSQDLMFTKEQEATNPEVMTHPLSHYWINTSHNTYLEGNQINSYSSTNAYINALKQGCRCVEIDCWDGADGEPMVYHGLAGFTLNNKIPFKEVIQACFEYAFKEYDYPLILSLEVNCSSKDQQDKMYDYLVEILGDKLHKKKPGDDETQLPSPESLKKMILIKASPDKLHKETKLQELVTYIHAVKFDGFKEKGSEEKFFKMSSFKESKTINNISKEFVKYNCRQISRIYPEGSRQFSSNLEPIRPWNAGCQLVALNYQTNDINNHLNRARFSANGGCGYVLKPEYLRNSSFDYSPSKNSSLDKMKFPGQKIKLTIISGHLIPKPQEGNPDVVDPWVHVRLHGHDDDDWQHNKENEKKTLVVQDNGFNPIWNFECELLVTVPDLAILDLKVKDSSIGKDQHLGSVAIPVPLMQEGYRRAYLVDYAGNPLNPASLLVKVEKLSLIDVP